MYIKQLKPRKQGRYKQGYINPLSCKKLFPGLKHDKIIYRSSYEKTFIQWLEQSNKIKFWGSECIKIPYISTIDKKTHNYYPDYFVETTDGECYVIEVKPYNQTKKPVNENGWAAKEYVRNSCKWRAALEYCDYKGFKFKIITERTINLL